MVRPRRIERGVPERTKGILASCDRDAPPRVPALWAKPRVMSAEQEWRPSARAAGRAVPGGRLGNLGTTMNLKLSSRRKKTVSELPSTRGVEERPVELDEDRDDLLFACGRGPRSKRRCRHARCSRSVGRRRRCAWAELVEKSARTRYIDREVGDRGVPARRTALARTPVKPRSAARFWSALFELGESEVELGLGDAPAGRSSRVDSTCRAFSGG